MRPIEFKHQNTVFAKDQPEYSPLPALKLNTPEGHVISCWRLSFGERLMVLFTGVVWVDLMTFNGPLAPSLLSVNRKELYSHPDDDYVPAAFDYPKNLPIPRVGETVIYDELSGRVDDVRHVVAGDVLQIRVVVI